MFDYERRVGGYIECNMRTGEKLEMVITATGVNMAETNIQGKKKKEKLVYTVVYYDEDEEVILGLF